MNKEKTFHYQPQNWLSGATGFNVATAAALNNRSELLADDIESTKLAEITNRRI
ncbi:hypothetical protein [uncultured Tolumonas sp.]|uniref:hypothetical protein n=1 Tax=uncultured Tolumonas sp. TaxID=263765 RepID=UPI002A0A9A8F|nr:hypothetical protein [uncultured Tolumonas sp.]